MFAKVSGRAMLKNTHCDVQFAQCKQLVVNINGPEDLVIVNQRQCAIQRADSVVIGHAGFLAFLSTTNVAQDLCTHSRISRPRCAQRMVNQSGSAEQRSAGKRNWQVTT